MSKFRSEVLSWGALKRKRSKYSVTYIPFIKEINDDPIPTRFWMPVWSSTIEKAKVCG